MDCPTMATVTMANMRVQQACLHTKAAADKLWTALPPTFLEFLKQNGFNASIIAAAMTLPYYIRVKPQASLEIPEIKELGLKLSPLTRLPNFFRLPPEDQTASTQAYQYGKVVFEVFFEITVVWGVDATSFAVVAALEISSSNHVLDLCAGASG